MLAGMKQIEFIVDDCIYMYIYIRVHYKTKCYWNGALLTAQSWEMVAGNVCLLFQLTVYFLHVSLLWWPAGGRFPHSDLHLLHLPPQAGAWLAWSPFPPAASARSLIGATACTPALHPCPNQQEEGLEGAWPIKAAVSAVAAALSLTVWGCECCSELLVFVVFL